MPGMYFFQSLYCLARTKCVSSGRFCRTTRPMLIFCVDFTAIPQLFHLPCPDLWAQRSCSKLSHTFSLTIHNFFSCRISMEEDKADRGGGGKTTSGNGQAWSSASPRGPWRTGEKRRKLVAKSYVVPQRPSRLRD